jgi:hypothetical protein
MTPDGRFYVAYQFFTSSTNQGINLNEYSAQGGLLEARTITTASATEPRVSVDNLGNAVVAWQQSTSLDSEILARRVSYLGGMGPVLTIASSPEFDLGNQTVALKRDGSAAFVVAYESDIPIFIKGNNVQTGNQVLVAEVSPSNQITTVSAGSVSQPAVSINNSGQYLLTYSTDTSLTENIDGRLGQLPSSVVPPPGPHA